MLVEEGANVVRRDYSAAAWQGPPEHHLGWWKTTLVDPQAGRLLWAPHDVMLNYFERLADDPAAEDVRYVLSLLLVRKRLLRVEAQEQDGAGREVVVLYCSRNEAHYRVPVVLPSVERAAEIQERLADLLKTHGS